MGRRWVGSVAEYAHRTLTGVGTLAPSCSRLISRARVDVGITGNAVAAHFQSVAAVMGLHGADTQNEEHDQQEKTDNNCPNVNHGEFLSPRSSRCLDELVRWIVRAAKVV